MSASTEDIRRGFQRLRAGHALHPAGNSASAIFESAADSAREIAAECLPLGVAIVMHLYPLCVLRCVPLPWWSAANIKRIKLLRDIDHHSLLLANAGSERTSGAQAPVKVARTREGYRVDGTYEYVSLSHVADVVLFSAPLDGSPNTMFCAADMRGETVQIGPSRFSGTMKLSDTCSVTFVNHHVPPDRCIEVPGESALTCMAQYQRSWFHLLLGEAYLARMETLQQQWKLPRAPEFVASLNELVFLKKYSLCLLNEASSPSIVDSLSRVTAAMKLRTSWLAQATAVAMRGRDDSAASELGFISRQPTSDDRILRSIGAAA